MATALTLKQAIAAVWQKFMGVIGYADISGIGDGTVKGAIVGLNGKTIKVINTQIKTDPYGQCNILQYIGNDTVALGMQIDGGYGAFFTPGGNIRVFHISSLPFEFANNMTLNAYIFYTKL